MIETLKYVLTVEGETEMWYFQWLKDQIQKVENRKYNASIVAKVEQNPASYSKRSNSKITPELIHICDVESTSEEHINKFENILKEMKSAQRQNGIIYRLGYSNFSFGLWMILHKMECFGPLNHRKQYLKFIKKCFNEKFKDLDDYKQEASFKRCLSKLNLEDVKIAIERADKIMQLNKNNNKILVKHSGYSYYRENPALTIYEVVKMILTECGV